MTIETLTPREHLLLEWLARPLTLARVADELFVPEDTVRRHVRSIYRKLGVSNRREATERARSFNLLDSDAVVRLKRLIAYAEDLSSAFCSPYAF
jgi:DNA-binding NarL/FixJ family response regulator